MYGVNSSAADAGVCKAKQAASYTAGTSSEGGLLANWCEGLVLVLSGSDTSSCLYAKQSKQLVTLVARCEVG